jgi:hypothetical protein
MAPNYTAGNAMATSNTRSRSITGNVNSDGSYYKGDDKNIIQFSDAWLRLNPSGDFTSGIYCATSVLRTDGELHVGASGTSFKMTSTGVGTAAISLTTPALVGTSTIVSGVSAVTDGSISLAKSDSAGVTLQWEDNYARWRRGGGGTVAGFRWDNFDSQSMRLTTAGDLTLGTDAITNGSVSAANYTAGTLITNYGTTKWQVSEADTAHQRVDCRDDAGGSGGSTQGRNHWYGVDSLGVTKSFRSALYDGTNYMYIDYESDTLTYSTSLSSSTTPMNFKIQSKVDANFIVEADSDNATETDNPTIQLWQDNQAVKAIWGIESSGGTAFTGTLDNSPYYDTLAGVGYIWGIGSVRKFRVEANGTTSDGYSAAARMVSGYDSGVANSMSCSGWFRSNGSTGWFNATYGGGIYQTDSTYVRVYGSKQLQVDNHIYLSGSGDVIKRTVTDAGYLQGSYSDDGGLTSSTGCIYTMGTNFKPAATTLGNMYGIGYGYGSASFLNSTDLGTTPANQWGMYVAADGNARYWINASIGASRQKGVSYASNFQLNSDIRRKTDISEYKPDGLNIKWYNFQLDSEQGTPRVGVIAQELLKNPATAKFVEETDPENYTVRYIDLHSAALAELQQENKELKARMDRLETLLTIGLN